VLHCERVLKQIAAGWNDPGAAAGAWFWPCGFFLRGKAGGGNREPPRRRAFAWLFEPPF
jgi:hypothetical protein